MHLVIPVNDVDNVALQTSCCSHTLIEYTGVSVLAAHVVISISSILIRNPTASKNKSEDMQAIRDAAY